MNKDIIIMIIVVVIVVVIVIIIDRRLRRVDAERIASSLRAFTCAPLRRKQMIHNTA